MAQVLHCCPFQMVAVIGLCREEPASHSKSGGRAREGERRREEEEVGTRGKQPQEEKRPRMAEEKENLMVMDQGQKVDCRSVEL